MNRGLKSKMECIRLAAQGKTVKEIANELHLHSNTVTKYLRHSRKYPTKQKTTTPEGLKEYRKLQQREIRKQHKDTTSKRKTRLAFLEWENQRLNRSLEVALNR